MRRLPLLLPLLLVCACDGSGPGRDTPAPAVPATREGRKQAEPATAPPTGISQVQKAHDELRKEVAELERRRQAGETIESWLVENQLKLCDNYIRACRIAIPLEARRSVEQAYGRQRQRQALLHKREGELGQEIGEVRGILDEHSKGVGEIPEGFTEAELRDKLADLLEELRKLRDELNRHNAEMKKNEDLLNSGKIEAGQDSLWTRELADLQATRKRIAALGS